MSKSPTRPASPLAARLLGLYLLANLTLVLLKLARLSWVGAWGWWRVTSLLWLPWLLVAVGWLVYLLRRRPR